MEVTETEQDAGIIARGGCQCDRCAVYSDTFVISYDPDSPRNLKASNESIEKLFYRIIPKHLTEAGWTITFNSTLCPHCAAN